MTKKITVSLTILTIAVCILVLLATGPSFSVEHKVERRTYQACVTDEGGEGQPVVPCVWDAKHQGNHKGRSFKVRADRKIVFITHKRAVRLLGHNHKGIA